MLEELVSLSPDARWWIKGDGTDVVKGLWQSASGEWSGDADLNDGKLYQQFKIFCERKERMNSIGMQESMEAIRTELTAIVGTVKDDLHFISSGMLYICMFTIDPVRSVLFIRIIESQCRVPRQIESWSFY